MARFSIVAAALALASAVQAQCGAGTPDATVTGSGGSFEATRGSSSVYSGSDYNAAIQAALDSISSGQRVSVMASGSIGANTITLDSGKIFEGCGTIDVGSRSGHGSIESLDTEGVQIPFLTMTGSPYFGLRFYGAKDLTLGQITLTLSGGMGIRFERDEAASSNVKIDSLKVTGAGSHALETWNIDGLEIGEVVAKDVAECGLLLQATTNARVGLVDGDNVAADTGYATLRMANNNGQTADGSYATNVVIDKVVSRGGGRGIFCVSQSGGATITDIDLAANGNNAILIENCYNLAIAGGIVEGGGEVRMAARDEFPNNKDISIALTVNDNSVRESPCGDNTTWDIKGSASQNIC
ncbi:hypothetical protein F4804DRAFT_104238 [Jackrogersella minutella]|nr:hypothetical protein F4804DRAFT_104238 [Jackrogersella minutella]